MKKLSANTPAGRAARGGKERGSPPPQPTSGMRACIWALLDNITNHAYDIQWAGRGLFQHKFYLWSLSATAGNPARIAAPRCPPRRGIYG